MRAPSQPAVPLANLAAGGGPRRGERRREGARGSKGNASADWSEIVEAGEGRAVGGNSRSRGARCMIGGGECAHLATLPHAGSCVSASLDPSAPLPPRRPTSPRHFSYNLRLPCATSIAHPLLTNPRALLLALLLAGALALLALLPPFSVSISLAMPPVSAFTVVLFYIVLPDHTMLLAPPHHFFFPLTSSHRSIHPPSSHHPPLRPIIAPPPKQPPSLPLLQAPPSGTALPRSHPIAHITSHHPHATYHILFPHLVIFHPSHHPAIPGPCVPLPPISHFSPFPPSPPPTRPLLCFPTRPCNPLQRLAPAHVRLGGERLLFVNASLPPSALPPSALPSPSLPRSPSPWLNAGGRLEEWGGGDGQWRRVAWRGVRGRAAACVALRDTFDTARGEYQRALQLHLQSLLPPLSPPCPSSPPRPPDPPPSALRSSLSALRQRLLTECAYNGDELDLPAEERGTLRLREEERRKGGGGTGEGGERGRQEKSLLEADGGWRCKGDEQGKEARACVGVRADVPVWQRRRELFPQVAVGMSLLLQYFQQPSNVQPLVSRLHACAAQGGGGGGVGAASGGGGAAAAAKTEGGGTGNVGGGADAQQGRGRGIGVGVGGGDGGAGWEVWEGLGGEVSWDERAVGKGGGAAAGKGGGAGAGGAENGSIAGEMGGGGQAGYRIELTANVDEPSSWPLWLQMWQDTGGGHGEGQGGQGGQGGGQERGQGGGKGEGQEGRPEGGQGVSHWAGLSLPPLPSQPQPGPEPTNTTLLPPSHPPWCGHHGCSHPSFLRVIFRHNTHEVFAFNRAASASRAPLLALLQDDLLPPASCHWLHAILHAHAAQPSLAALGYRTGKVDVDSRGGEGVRAYQRQSRALWAQPAWEARAGVRGYMAGVVDSGPLVVRRAVWERMGGLDEGMSTRGQSAMVTDWVLAFHVWMAGHKVRAWLLRCLKRLDEGMSMRGRRAMVTDWVMAFHACTGHVCMHGPCVHARAMCACTGHVCMHGPCVHARAMCACTGHVCMHGPCVHARVPCTGHVCMHGPCVHARAMCACTVPRANLVLPLLDAWQ
ncbi:unnamed protein product [Closterium sp. Naga37s-1]|nr:unnamed protein product [Closterium sp. Naga37s-1]